ncbi:hypothetical protein [Armatimonas rosea]|uniref:NolW-like domain-containing protein n=1 Tax=Armatimonas rosea TaxID=685828 RepID=A0A7W9W618_ARMRO|nr:hypothetical protein [Armatimonas rosea]MBB6050148.1 hypothetical protein [Armatimonas rosea]
MPFPLPPALVQQALPQEKPRLVKIELHFVAPSAAMKRIDGNGKQKSLRPDGLRNVIISDVDKVLILQGTEEAVAEFKALLRLIDVKPVVLELKVQFVQEGENTIYLRLRTADAQKTRVTLGEDALARGLLIIPHLSDDNKSVTFEILREVGEPSKLADPKKVPLMKAGALGQELRIPLDDGLLFLTATLLKTEGK